MVVAGFEPVDVMLGLRELVRRSAERESAEVANAYRRAVRADGNRRAVEAMERAFAPEDAHWRGLGVIPGSGLALADELAHLDATRRFGVAPDPSLPDHLPGCKCGQVMAGMVEPEECSLFAASCTPDSPRGPCMVSFEGTCRSRFLFRKA
jgi:hydrogenase expression/formation protein HypD